MIQEGQLSSSEVTVPEPHGLSMPALPCLCTQRPVRCNTSHRQRAWPHWLQPMECIAGV